MNYAQQTKKPTDVFGTWPCIQIEQETAEQRKSKTMSWLYNQKEANPAMIRKFNTAQPKGMQTRWMPLPFQIGEYLENLSPHRPEQNELVPFCQVGDCSVRPVSASQERTKLPVTREVRETCTQEKTFKLRCPHHTLPVYSSCLRQRRRGEGLQRRAKGLFIFLILMNYVGNAQFWYEP